LKVQLLFIRSLAARGESENLNIKSQ
jgi:hypothetical protein